MESRRISPNPTGIGQIANQLTQPAMQQAGLYQAQEPIFDPTVQPTTPLPTESPSVFHQNFGKFERAGSTYSWRIMIPRKPKLHGHSKPRNMAEKANKQELLLDCIRRLNAKDYFREGNQVEFYRNWSDDDRDSQKMFTLHGTRFSAELCIQDQYWLNKYLHSLFSPPVHHYGSRDDMFPTGGNAQTPAGKILIPDGSGYKDPFDLSRRFKTLDDLSEYTTRLLEAGHPHGRVLDFQQKKAQYFRDIYDKSGR